MNKKNPLIYLLKKISWPVGLIIVAVAIASLGSLSGLLVPWFTKRMVDDFTFTSLDPKFIVTLVFVFLLNAILSGLGYYLLNKIGEKVIYAIRSVLWRHIIHLKMPFLIKTKVAN